jgi:tripartite-type tricarboxylate transporter receptor subunit TctC
MRRIRIVLVMLTAALGTVLAIDASRSQGAFPTKAVRIVIPYPAGGGTDVLGGVVADQLSRKWGRR